MFKPNIRGVGKHNLRLELTGWRNREDNSLIKHRYPWRLSWIELATADSSLTPMLSRSGQVFLVQESPVAKTKTILGVSRSRSRTFALFGVISAISLLLGFLLVPTSMSKKTAVAEPRSTATMTDCKEVLLNPENEIAKWLNGTGSKQIVIHEIQREELGGIQFRKISISCDDQKRVLQTTFTLRDKTWQLKKFARLDN
jgi:hypothetical protein